MVKSLFPFQYYLVYPKYLNALNNMFLKKKKMYSGNLRLKNLTTCDRLTVDICEPVLHRNQKNYYCPIIKINVHLKKYIPI